MKIFGIENNYLPEGEGKPIGWYILADSAISNTGKPFYLPEGLGKVTVSLSIAIRLSRLGKFIDPKFAHRYYSNFAPALQFRLPDFEESLRALNLPDDAARNFDKALFIGDFQNLKGNAEVKMLVNGEERSLFSFVGLKENIDNVLSKVSRLNTIKMGDIILPGLCPQVPLKEGDWITVLTDGLKSFEVKVK